MNKNNYCDISASCEIVKTLKQENAKLKNDIKLYSCIERFGTKECHCACKCLGNEFCFEADKKINQLKASLEEIKKICIRHDLDRFQISYFILQKIREVQ